MSASTSQSATARVSNRSRMPTLRALESFEGVTSPAAAEDTNREVVQEEEDTIVGMYIHGQTAM